MKNSQSTSGLRRLENRRGQAVIEYTLMLIISVALIMAMMQLIFKPFGDFVSDYMGKYTACLLEYGELPSLGYETPSELDEDGDCNAQFQPATFTGGRPPVPTSGNGSDRKDTTTQNSQNRGNSGSGGGTTAGSASRYGSRNVTNRTSFGVENRAAPGKTVEIALENNGSGGFFGGGGDYGPGRQRGRKTMAVGLAGLTEEEKKKLERNADGIAGTVVPTDQQVRKTQKRLTVQPPPERTPAQEDKPFTIGNFIRYLFIAALIIALVVFIGGQALQMSKSGEK